MKQRLKTKLICKMNLQKFKFWKIIWKNYLSEYFLFRESEVSNIVLLLKYWTIHENIIHLFLSLLKLHWLRSLFSSLGQKPQQHRDRTVLDNPEREWHLRRSPVNCMGTSQWFYVCTVLCVRAHMCVCLGVCVIVCVCVLWEGESRDLLFMIVWCRCMTKWVWECHMKCADLFGILRVEHRVSISISVLHINSLVWKYGVRNKKEIFWK